MSFSCYLNCGRGHSWPSIEPLVQWLKLPAWKVGDCVFEHHSGLQASKKQNISSPLTRKKINIVWSLRDRDVACSPSDRQSPNSESCVWRAVSSQSSYHPQEVLLSQFSLYVHKGGLSPHSFLFIWPTICQSIVFFRCDTLRSHICVIYHTRWVIAWTMGHISHRGYSTSGLVSAHPREPWMTPGLL